MSSWARTAATSSTASKAVTRSSGSPAVARDLYLQGKGNGPLYGCELPAQKADTKPEPKPDPKPDPEPTVKHGQPDMVEATGVRYRGGDGNKEISCQPLGAETEAHPLTGRASMRSGQSLVEAGNGPYAGSSPSYMTPVQSKYPSESGSRFEATKCQPS